MTAKEKKSLTAKSAEDAKGITIKSNPREEREDNAKYGNGHGEGMTSWDSALVSTLPTSATVSTAS